MPIAAVAAGAFAVSEIATVGIAAMSMFETIAAVGAITSAVGALTGNDDLMKIGGIAALAGGVGAFAQGKGWLATGDAMKTAASDAATNTGTMANRASIGMPETNVMGGEGANVGTASASELAGSTGGLPADSIASNITRSGLNPAMDTVGNITDIGNKGGLFDAGTSQAPIPGIAGARGTLAEALAPAAGSTSSMSFNPLRGASSGSEIGILGNLSKFGAWLKQNKELASMAGNFIGGAFDERKQAETEWLKARAASERAQTANGSAVPNMNFRSKSTGPTFPSTAPTYNAPRPAGLFYAK